ncbi:hypothetical protein KIN20_003193 [Parelaphostrongylus tenuis]|uniref:Uncharacterized protein n=1 Tax=Parelaphostrongylus tenuis TaxID=148309 RepID=A0AAD5LWB6_PARTN|nr:hypothetical protein KIN20_003193 [Parelaphostrongylus tenuis]
MLVDNIDEECDRLVEYLYLSAMKAESPKNILTDATTDIAKTATRRPSTHITAEETKTWER